MQGLPTVNDDQDTARGLFALAAAAAMFSWGFVIVKSLGLAPPAIAFARLAIASVFLLGIFFGLKVPRPASWRPILAAGFFFGLHQLLYIAATLETSIAIVTLIGAMQPLIVAIISRRVVGERPPKSMKWLALLAASGVGVVVWANYDSASRSTFGDLLAVVNVFAFTGFFMANKKARAQGASTLAVTAGGTFVAMFVVAPALLFVDEPLPGQTWQWLLIALLALGPGNGHLLVNWAHQRVTAALAALTLVAVPLLAPIWAHLVLGEPYGLRHMLGMGLVVLAVELGRRAELARIAEYRAAAAEVSAAAIDE